MSIEQAPASVTGRVRTEDPHAGAVQQATAETAKARQMLNQRTLKNTIRATGVGSALAFGRVGAILSAFIGAAVLASGGGARFFILLALAMGGAFVALALIRNHIPPAAKAD